ncbi:MAG: ABC transporter permease [Butyrivibrio sp.]|jgi:ABC-2 type transport system permease protein|nr:ABC transporter permease [Butyrivibrio sp.]
MTSENSSLIKSKKKAYKIRFAPLTIVSLITMLLFYVSAVIVLVNRAYMYGVNSLQSPEAIHMEQINAISKVIGFRQVGIVFAVVLAFVFALSEFNYLFSQKQLDFFVSQPTSNKKRFITRYVDGIATFTFLYLIVVAVTLILAAIFGTFSRVLLLEVLCAFVYVLVVYLAFYNITILGIMLSGNLFTAIIMSIFWQFVFSVGAALLSFYREIFFITYSFLTNESYFFSPAVDVIHVIEKCTGVFGYDTGRLTMNNLKSMICSSWINVLDIAITGLIALFFAVMAYKKRKNEWAGKTICFPIVQKIVKLSLSIISGLLLGLIIYYIYSEYNSSRNYMIFAAMVIGCILSAFIIEVYIQADFKLFYKGIFGNIIALAAVVFIFFSLNNDIFGYDSYVPDENAYSSYFIVRSSTYGYMDYFNNYRSFSYDDGRARDLEKRMFLTDKDAMKELADYSSEYVKNTNREKLYENAWSVQVGYRLNSGRIVYRTLFIPYDVDAALMDRIIGSKEYITSYYDVFKDFSTEQEMFTQADCSFTTDAEMIYGVMDDYEAFKLVYQQDVLQNYSYTMVNNNDFVGIFEISNYEYSDDDYYYVDVSYPIYSTYTNTIEYLQSIGVYNDSARDVDNIKSITVENYYPGHDLEVEDESTLEYENSKSVEYTDMEQISEIMEHAVSANFVSDWFPYDKFNNQYGINVQYDDAHKENDTYISSYFFFEKGCVPDFVVKDTNN